MVTVVCTGGEAPPSALSLVWLDSSERVIAADGGLQMLRLLGRKADFWIGDGDSLPGSLESWADCFLVSKLLPRDKDETDTEAAVRAAVEGGATEVWLMGGAGGRMDHWLANLRLMASRPVTRWLTAREEVWNLGPGESVTLPAGTVSIFPIGTGPWRIASDGLRWPLEGLDFSTWHSISNEAEPEATVHVSEGRVLVLRPFDLESP